MSASAPHVLREYSLIADGERGALIGPRGDIAWLCFPGWADPAVFADLIGSSGRYTVTPRGRYVWGGSYEPGTLIWRSRWITETGIVECREALSMHGDRDRAVLLRRLRAVDGPANLDVNLELCRDYGRAPATYLKRGDDGAWRGRLDGCAFAWGGAPEAEPGDDGLATQLELEPGESCDLVLLLTRGEAGDLPDPDEEWSGTEAAWRSEVPGCEGTAAPRDTRHAYAVLRGLTASGGGMVAAATTSLPERAGEGRSFDYRYAWIRDQAITGQAIAELGALPLLDGAVRFVAGRLADDGPNLVPAYTVSGGMIPDQVDLDLPGYPGGTDIVGNHVNSQFQLDAFGEALLLFAAAARHDHLDADSWKAVEVAATAIEQRWGDVGAGIWELGDAHWTHSRLICAAGLRAISRCHGPARETARWTALADAITAEASAGAVHPSGRWQRTPDDPRVDSALLFAGLRGAANPDDPRTLATLEAVLDDLTEDGYAYRYRPDERPLGEAEGAFLLCGFLVSLSLHQQGRELEAARWFERNRAACGTPGLLSEEYDVRQRQLRGNLPQAFVHALLLECSAVLGTSPGG